MLNKFYINNQEREALQYFGFEGTYDPNNDVFKTEEGGGASAVTQISTGNIYYKDDAFVNGFDYLYAIAIHEKIHSQNIKSGKYLNRPLTLKDKYIEERDTYIKGYKMQGLYPDSKIDFLWRINAYGWQAFIENDFNYKMWHIIYKIPRKW